MPGLSPTSIALTAIIEENEGRFSYRVLTHPSASPDFHHHDSFVLHLQRPAPGAALTNREIQV